MDLGAPLRPAPGPDRRDVLERRRARVPQDLEQPVQDTHRGPRVRQRAVVRLHVRPEVGGKGGELVVAHLRARQRLPRERDGVEHLRSGPRVVEASAGRAQEPHVEGRVVRDEDRTAHELEERGQNRFDPGCVRDHAVRDPRQLRDEGGDDGTHRAHERLELAQRLTAAHPHRPDLRDRVLRRVRSRRLQVHHDEVDGVERGPQIRQGQLPAAGAGVRAIEGRHGDHRRTRPGHGRGASDLAAVGERVASRGQVGEEDRRRGHGHRDGDEHRPARYGPEEHGHAKDGEEAAQCPDETQDE